MKNINTFNKIHNYIHSYDFPHYDYLLENKNYFEETYSKNIYNNPSNRFNIPLSSGEVYNFLNEYLISLVQEYYLVSPLYANSSIGIYKQDNKTFRNFPHFHIHSSSITTVIYLDPPSTGEGGGISFFFEGTPYTIHPEPNKVYIFPSWLLHTPEPQTSTIPRYSLNWGYMSYIRPIHKITGDLW